MRERKEHVRLGKGKKEKPFLLVCGSSQSMDLLAFWIRVEREAQRWAGAVGGVQGEEGIPQGCRLLLPGE